MVVAARAGDQVARDELIAGYLPLVYNIVGRALNGHADVDDVVQESLLRMLDGLGSLRDPEAFRSWLVAVTMNEIRRYWQGHRRTPAPVDGGLQDAYDIADPGADFVDLTIVQLGLSGQRKEVTEATRWLEPDDRALLSLWWLEAAGVLTRGEVASALGLTPEHAAVRIQRMKGQLETARVVVRALAGIERCGELSGFALSWDGVPSALWRKRIARHARTCAVCSGHWSGLIPAEGLLVGLALVPVAAASAGLLAALHAGAGPALQTAAHASTAPAASTQPIPQPVPQAPQAPRATHAAHKRRAPASRRDRRDQRARRRRRAAAVIAGVAAVAALGGAFRFFTDSGQDPSHTVADAPGTTTEAAANGMSTSTRPVPPSASASNSPAKPSSSASPSAKPPAPPAAKPSSHPAPPKPAPSTKRAAPSAESGQPAAAQDVLSIVNSERAKAGCSALTSNPKLYDAALKHSENMAAQNFFDHTDPSGAGPGERITAAGYKWSTYGENIARGQADAAAVMDTWMHSPGHRANILNCAFKEIGIGVHNGSGGPWWTQDFGAQG